MEKIVKQLPADEVKKYDSYMFVEVEKRINKETGEPYMFTDSYYTNLARVSRPLVLEEDKLRPFFHLIHLGGGMMQDEVYRTDLVVDDDSNAIFTSQSANKVYENQPGHEPTKYYINLQVGKNAMAEFINDAIIVYETGKYKQYSTIYLEPTSTLIYTEIFSPGWSKSGSDYTYHLMLLNTKLYMNKKLALYDNLVFDPINENPSDFGIMDGFERCGTAFFVDPRLNQEHVEAIRKGVKETFNNKDQYEIGISSFDFPSVIVRVLANETYEIEHVFKFIHKYVRETVLGLPMVNLRKHNY